MLLTEPAQLLDTVQYIRRDRAQRLHTPDQSAAIITGSALMEMLVSVHMPR
jgi:hypothetical protein